MVTAQMVGDINQAYHRLSFDLRPWHSPERVTTCNLMIRVDGISVWLVRHEDTALEIQIDDLLAHLSEFWKPLMFRQGYLSDVKSVHPSRVRQTA